MASAAAELFVKVTADIKGLTSGFGAAVGAAKQLGEGIDEAAGHWVDANGRMRDASGKFVSGAKAAGAAATSIGDIMKGVAGGELLADGIRSAADAMVNLGARSLQLAGELEQNKVAFTTMLKSGEAADKMLRDLATFAASTPFELRGLTDSAKKLIAFGFSSQSIIPIMTSLGDAIGGIGGGQEAIGQVTMALGQMAAKGKVSAEEMNQFAEKGINTWKYVAQAIGKSVPEAMKLAEKGAIDAATAIPAILQGMSKEFGGMMEKQSKTWNGALSNFQDATDQAMTKIGDAIIRMGLGELIQKMTAGVNNLAAAFDSGRIIPAIQATEAAVLGLATAFTAYLLPGARVAGASMVTAFTAGAAAAAPFIALAAAVAFAAYPIIKNWQEIKWGLQDLFDYGMGKMTQFYNYGSGIVRDFANNWLTGMNYIAGVIRSVLGDTIADKLIGGVRSAGAAFSGFAAKAVPVLKYVGNAVRENVSGDLQSFAGRFKETWGDAFASAKLVTVDLFKTTAAGKVDVAKITAELLGLKKGQMAASDAAKKHHETAAQAARRHTAEAKRVEEQYMRNLKTYLAQEEVTYKLGDALRKVAEDKQRLGRAFDEAGAKAEVYRSILGQLEAAFGKTSLQVRSTKTAIAELESASRNGGAASAAANKVLNESAASLDMAALKARVLGQEYDASAAAAQEYEKAVGALLEQGLKPGNAELDKAVQKYNEATEAKKRAALAAMSYTQATGSIIDAAGSLFGSVTNLVEAFGISLPESLSKTISGTIKAAKAMVDTIEASTKLVESLKAISNIASKDPTGGFATLVIGGLILGYNMLTSAIDANKKRVEEKNRVMTEARDRALEVASAEALLAANIESSNLQSRIRQAQAQAELEQVNSMMASFETSVRSAVKQATLAFMGGSKTWATDLRDNLKQAMYDGLLDMLVFKMIGEKLNEQYAVIKANLRAGNSEAAAALMNNLTEDVMALVKPLAEGAGNLIKAAGATSADAVNFANKAIAQVSELQRRNAEALASYGGNIQQSFNRTMEKALNRGGPTAGERDLLERLKTEQARLQTGYYQTGMATGGLVTGPVIAKMGEGGRDEAVLPLNDRVFSSIAQGIASAGVSGTQVVINYTGNGKWTREDAQGLGRLLVSELRAMGVR